jgi:replication factor C subunit 2/4
MTDYSNTTRFALACNDSSKIIEPIQSRCAIIRFTKLADDEILERLIEVTKLEGVKCDQSGLEAIIFTAEGDMRYALNNLQATNAGFGEVTKENVFKVCDIPHPETMNDTIKFCLMGQFDNAAEKITMVYEEGYSVMDIVGTLTKLIQNFDNINEEQRLAYLKEVTILKMRILEGTNSLLQIHGMLARLCMIAA